MASIVWVSSRSQLEFATVMGFIERHVGIGAGTKILGPVHIGAYAGIGANAFVLSDVPSGATAVGMPAKNSVAAAVVREPDQSFAIDPVSPISEVPAPAALPPVRAEQKSTPSSDRLNKHPCKFWNLWKPISSRYGCLSSILQAGILGTGRINRGDPWVHARGHAERSCQSASICL